RARARTGAWRPARAAHRAWPRQPLRARATDAGYSARCLTLVEAVDDGSAAGQSLLELRQPLLDAPPAGGDEIDEQGEVVDARVPLGEDVSLDPLEPADDLVRQAAHLGEVTGARPEVLAESVLDPRGQARLEAGRRRGKGLDGVACALQRGVEGGRVSAAGG